MILSSCTAKTASGVLPDCKLQWLQENLLHALPLMSLYPVLLELEQPTYKESLGWEMIGDKTW